MHVRLAAAADLTRGADIFAEAFVDEELTAWLYPRRREFYADYRRAWLREIKRTFYASGAVVCVVETEEGEGEGSLVVGLAMWLRHGEDEAARKWQGDSVVHKIERLFQQVVTAYEDTISPDRAASASHHELLVAAPDLFTPITSRWHLIGLATARAFQRRGVARLLTAWGLQVAGDEGVPVTLDSTIPAEPLYRGMGFRDYSYNVLGPDVEVDGPALIWEPAGMEGRFGTRWPARREALVGRGRGRVWKPVDAWTGEEEEEEEEDRVCET